MFSRSACPALAIAALAALAACSIVPEGGGSQSARTSASQAARAARPAVPSGAQDRQCLARLGASEALFTPLPDEYRAGGCSIRNTVRLSALRSDSMLLELSSLGPVACPLANSFAGWARFGVDRAARHYLGSPLARIETMGSYNCRNVAGSSRRSAHSTANAIDVAGFVLADGRRISVKDGWAAGGKAERAFLRVIHASACKRFGTVLGPAYNAAHHDHFHLEGGSSGFCR